MNWVEIRIKFHPRKAKKKKFPKHNFERLENFHSIQSLVYRIRIVRGYCVYRLPILSVLNSTGAAVVFDVSPRS